MYTTKCAKIRATKEVTKSCFTSSKFISRLLNAWAMHEEKIRKILHCNLFSILTRYTAQKIPCHSTVLETSPCKLFYASKKDLQLVNMVHHWRLILQQQRPFNGLWSGTTRVGRYQKELILQQFIKIFAARKLALPSYHPVLSASWWAQLFQCNTQV